MSGYNNLNNYRKLNYYSSTTIIPTYIPIWECDLSSRSLERCPELWTS